MNKKNPLVFLDMSIDGDPFERMVFELFSDVVPRTADNFRALCTGEKGISSKCGKPLHYKGTFFHRIIRGSMAQGGDFLGRDGDYGESIYGGKFPDESSKLKYDGPGLLSIAIADRDTRGSLFNITFKGNRNLDRKHVVFGRLVHGHDVLKKIETAGDEEGRPTVTVKIINSGEIHNDKMKVNKSKIEVDACGTNSHEVKRREKHKKSAKNRRKKRRYYSSESESSFSSETKSSESDGDSDSYTSSSDVSSSSDDRRRKRKRSSKRDKYKRGKRKDKRHEKKRKRHDKRSKHKSKRMRNDLSASESESKSKSSENNGHIQGPDQKQKNEAKMIVDKQPLDEEREDASLRHKELETTDMIETEEGEFPKENGEHQSNGSEGNSSSKESSDVEPDVMDDRVGKSRSQSASPKRAASKGMSVSPRRSLSGSRSVSPARSLSRSRTVSRGPPWISRKSRSISRSPVRSGSSRSLSAERGRQARSSISRGHSPSPPKRSLSRSSLRTSSRKSLRPSVSRSPVKVAKSIIRNPRRSSRRSISRSPPISSRRSISRSSGRAPSRKHTSPSHSRSPASVGRRVKSPVSDRGRRSSRSLSRDGASMRIRRGRGFSDRYAYGRRYRSPSPVRSPVRSNRFGGHDRYSSYRRSPRRYRSPSRGITPPRYRSRKRSRTPSVSRSPIRHRRRYSRSPIRRRYTRSPARSHSPVARSRYRSSPHATHRRRSPSRSRSLSGSRSSSHDSLSPPPKQPTRAKSSSRSRSRSKSRSSSGSPLAKRGHVVSYGDGSPDSGRR